ncbi:MAG: type II toxin-antitoxin system PemK/MazF family toxin, partial [Candidatus Omnitrophica bacterium]|nr:type II toxin-antitoxin system PemK/MazF family toxin [Candidatus Omnitrophota bacterium]
MKRGEVWWVNFGRTLGGEVKKICPAVIVSNNASN